jgi:hypothetical protein
MPPRVLHKNRQEQLALIYSLYGCRVLLVPWQAEKEYACSSAIDH